MTVSSTSPPHDLQLAIDFVNTADLEAETDELATPGDLGNWLAARDLVGRASPEPTASEHACALALRDALRGVMAAHNGGAPAPQAMTLLEQVAEQGRLSVRFGLDGTVSVLAREDGIAGALARLLVPVAAGASDGTWARVKACGAQDCQWAFYDASRNRSGRWCDMAVCGNRHKVRAYRERSGAP